MDVLVVEDEPLIRESVAQVLRDAGYAVSEAASGEQALALLGQDPRAGPAWSSPTCCSALGMDGLALGAEALRRLAPVGIVYATGNPQHFDGRVLGPSERYLVKPYTPEGLLQVVRRAMAVGRDQVPQKVCSTRSSSLRGERVASRPGRSSKGTVTTSSSRSKGASRRRHGRGDRRLHLVVAGDVERARAAHAAARAAGASGSSASRCRQAARQASKPEGGGRAAVRAAPHSPPPRQARTAEVRVSPPRPPPIAFINPWIRRCRPPLLGKASFPPTAPPSQAPRRRAEGAERTAPRSARPPPPRQAAAGSPRPAGQVPMRDARLVALA
jgi:CheY-like chemotaxis protein